MKQFFKTMFASVLGVLIATGVIILGGLVLLMGIAASGGSGSTYTPKDNSVLKLHLKGSLSDTAVENPFGGLMGEEEESLAVQDVVKAIRTAKENGQIKGIYLDAVGMSGGFAGFEGGACVAFDAALALACVEVAAELFFQEVEGDDGVLDLQHGCVGFVEKACSRRGGQAFVFRLVRLSLG